MTYLYGLIAVFRDFTTNPKYAQWLGQIQICLNSSYFGTEVGHVTMFAMNSPTLGKVIAILKKESENWNVPIVTLVANTGKSPYRVLISCLLSLRTKDETTAEAVKRLFARADTPQEMLKLPLKEIEKLIFPVGFFRVKAKLMHSVSEHLLEIHGGKVPDDMDKLLAIKGVGRKTANLVLTEAFEQDAMCVDVHVHRISNRFGYVKTRNPHETEMALRTQLPRKYWSEYNALLVAFGQHLCRPVSPHCSACPVRRYCPRIGVRTSR